MSLVKVDNISVESIVTCVPKNKIDNLQDANIPEAQARKILEVTGIRYRHIVTQETTADLCYAAAEHIFGNKVASKADVAILVFVTQSPDYLLPSTSTVLQERLGLSQNIIAFDVGMGCSGYAYGLSIISTLLEKISNPNATALLLVGDTISKICNPKDLTTYPMFGDAGSATLLKKTKGSDISFDLYTDGKGAEAIMVKDGGFRNPMSEESSIEQVFDGVNMRTKKDLILNGMNVFSFGISKIPDAIKSFHKEAFIKEGDVDFYVFHQANMFMNEKIRKKLKLPEEKVPYSLYNYANVSSATIPLTICSELNDKIGKRSNIIACGFGVGLSWGTVNFALNENSYLKLIEL